jgi:hypothetical protein
MKSLSLLLSTAGLAFANTAPTVVIKSAQMRPGTTFMDVVYRVEDPDDTTVKTRALAFVDGVRSFANVIRPVSFVEGTGAKLGDSISANADHTLTWDVAADWNIDLGQVKFEVLAMDTRGLLPFEWITIPAAEGVPELTISKDTPTNAQMLSAFFWKYATGDSGLTLMDGVLSGNPESGVFDQVDLVSGNSPEDYAAAFLFKRMNLDVVDVSHAIRARAGIVNPQGWHAANQTYAGTQIIHTWRGAYYPAPRPPAGLSGVIAIDSHDYNNLVLRSDGEADFFPLNC